MKFMQKRGFELILLAAMRTIKSTNQSKHHRQNQKTINSFSITVYSKYY